MNIVVGVTGGIAAYKSVSLVRLLLAAGHEVHVVPTPDALRFVGQPTWEAISRNPVTTSVHDDVAQVRHVALGQAADLVVIAPATANTIAKLAAGIADNLLGTTLLATTAPVLVAPAMHTEMWRHPATQAAIATLVSRGVHILGPDAGPLTGGDSGEGRMVEPDRIAEAIADLVAPGDAAGLRVLVSAGGTREPIDPVRFLGNRSSGRQGVACALAAADRGAEVSLVAASIDADVLAEALAHPRITVHPVVTGDELSEALARLQPEADVVLMAAAVADYRMATVSDGKLSKDGRDRVTLELIPTADILEGLVATRPEGQVIVGFAAETEPDEAALVERALDKRRRKGVDLLALNRVGWTMGFESETNEVRMIDASGGVGPVLAGSKRQVAEGILDAALSAR